MEAHSREPDSQPLCVAGKGRRVRQPPARAPSSKTDPRAGDCRRCVYDGLRGPRIEFRTMAKKKADTIIDQLKTAIENCGETPYRVAKDSGVSQPVLTRFLNGDRDIRMETAALLASYLGLRLVRAER